MAEEILMPRLSDTMTEGVIAAWHKKVGDTVKKGDLLAEVETDKATMELESYKDGTLLHIGVQNGGKLQVNDLLAIIGAPGEDISGILNKQGGAPAAAPAQEAPKQEQAPQAAPAAGGSSVDLSKVEEVILMPRLSDTMTEGVIAEWHKKIGDDVKKGDLLAEIETDKATMELESYKNGKLLYIGAQKGDKVPVNALLCIIGEEGKVDVNKIVAAAKGGGTASADASQPAAAPAAQQAAPVAQAAAPAAKGAPAAVSAPAGQVSFDEVPVSQMRKVIAKRLGESLFTAPHFYVTMAIDMDNAIAARTKINEKAAVKISFNDLVLKACAIALKQHPAINSSWLGDKIRVNHHVNIGVAVAIEDGLLVPVVRFADTKSLTQIGTEVKDFAARAKAKKLQPQDWEGSTFTISNLGMFGVDEFTAIINPPDACILAVGGISQVPVVKDGVVKPGNIMKVTLSCDHRVVDGATGAAFLQTLKSFLEEPLRMLV